MGIVRHVMTYVGITDCPDEGRLAVSNMADGADVDGGLAGDNFGIQRRNRIRVKPLQRLLRQVLLGVTSYLLELYDFIYCEANHLEFAFLRTCSSIDLSFRHFT